uniref:Glyco_18 domain-containing protein n=1 Tax=Caenorhabditis japonica TaxID=281687 RepID=A0A8R1I1H7_CAEJA
MKLFKLLSIFLLLQPTSAIPVVCYYILNQPRVSEVPIELCSNVILINSAHISEKSGSLQIFEPDISEFSELHEKRKDLQLLVSITSSNPSFSLLTSNPSLMEQFSRNLTATLLKFNLNGVDIDWEFPAWSRDAKRADRSNFSMFLKILNSHLKPQSLTLSVAVPGPPTISRVAYDVEVLNRYADMVQVMNYDFHVYNKLSNPVVGFNAPLHPMRAEISVLGEMNVESSMKTWLDTLGLDRNKTIFGIPTYARAFQLLTHYLHKPYSPATRSRPEFTNYDDICELVKNPSYTKVWNRHAQAPYLYGPSGLWISYENPESIAAKMDMAKHLKVGGVMVFSIGSDDVTGKCGDTFPLLKLIAKLAN